MNSIEHIHAILKGETETPQEETSIPFGDHNSLLAVFFKHWERTPFHTFVINPSGPRNIYPAVLLRSNNTWEVEPSYLDRHSLEESWSIPFTSDWVTALLEITAERLNPLLPDPLIRYSHSLVEDEEQHTVTADFPPLERVGLALQAFHVGGYRSFLPGKNKPRRWAIAVRWPVWREQGLQWPEMAAEIAQIEGRKTYSADTLRKTCGEMGLRLE
jgi:hypothetical protein